MRGSELGRRDGSGDTGEPGIQFEGVKKEELRESDLGTKMGWRLKDLGWGKGGRTGESDLEVGNGQCSVQCSGWEKIMGAGLGRENERELEDLSKDGGCKGEGMKVLLRTGDELGIRRFS